MLHKLHEHTRAADNRHDLPHSCTMYIVEYFVTNTLLEIQYPPLTFLSPLVYDCSGRFAVVTASSAFVMAEEQPQCILLFVPQAGSDICLSK